MTGPRAALADLTVLDLSDSAAGAFCAKCFADLGAAVTKIEPPEGDALRRAGPFPPPPNDAAGERSAPFLWLNTGKRGLTLDLTRHQARAILLALIDRADALILSGKPHRLAAAGIATGDLLARNPRLVITEVTPFGNGGPHADWASSDIVQLAMSGWMHTTGRPEREPLAEGGMLAEVAPGLAAASATLMAIHARQRGGHGQRVEVAQQEVLALMQPYLTVGYAYTGVQRKRNGMPFPMTILPAADGYLGINVLTQAQWEALCAFAGLTDLLDDDRLRDPTRRAAHAQELTGRFAAWAADKSKIAVFAEGQQWRVPFGFVPRVGEAPELEQHRARGFFEHIVHPTAGELRYPGVPFRMRGRPPLRRAPLLGEHTRAILAELAQARDPVASHTQGAAPAATTTDERRRGPLADVRIVDLTMWWSGPLTTELFALMGAEVIKVESIQRVDGWRLAGSATGSAGTEHSAVFNGVNLNKRGITLDLSRDAGRALLRRLVERADILAENYSPRVMENLGLTDDVLFAWNPRLVIISMPAFGLTGPWRDYVGFAPTIEQLSSLPELTGHGDGPPVLSGNSLADPTAGLTGAFALLAALHERNASGQGQHVDLSQLEALTSLLGDALLAQQLIGSEPVRRGNRLAGAVQGCYRCRDEEGEDRWLTLTVRTETEWLGLCRTLGRPDLAHTPRFADSACRGRHHDELDAIIEGWTRGRGHIEAMAALQAAGVPAGAVATPRDLLHDPHLNARGYFVPLTRGPNGAHPYPGLPFRFSAMPGAVYAAAPTLGQHNDEVLGGILGMPDDERAALAEAGIIGAEQLQ